MSDVELLNVRGGIGKTYFYGIIVGSITFLIGLIDGILRPFKCNE
jgi:hypothetical protein